MTTVIKTNNLTKKYKENYALKNCTIEIEKGEIYGIVGKNGAGKSTLLKLLSGITEPTEGTIEIFESTELPKMRKRMSAIVENPELFGELSAKENLEYFRIQRGVTDEESIDQILKLVGLENTGNKPTKKFSVGMKQRLALALSLLTNPEILILDEPTSGIDPSGIVEIRRILKKLNRERGVTILISSHILSELSNLATKIAIIDNGMIKEELSLEELYEKTSEHISLHTDDTAKTTTILEEKLKIKDYEIKPDNDIIIYEEVENVEEIVKALVEENIGVKKIVKDHKTLEEYYIDITGGEQL